MLSRFFAAPSVVFAWGPLALILAGCGGGSGGGSGLAVSCDGASGSSALCVTTCNLGCTTAGTCEVTDIAQNQRIQFQFSQDIDPASVNSGSVSLRTPNGEPPVGQFFVNGNRIEFVPSVQVLGGRSFFGFRAGETYALSLPTGTQQTSAVRSTSGDILTTGFTCSVVVTGGIIDYNSAPPTGTLVTPTASIGVPADAVIRVAFDEVVDNLPFDNATNLADNPVRVRLSRGVPDGNGGAVCANGATRVDVDGLGRLTIDAGTGTSIYQFVPFAPLPSSACITVDVTDRVRDLSGRNAIPTSYEFVTTVGTPIERMIVEEFNDATNLDRTSSAGDWGGGQAVFGELGGDGRHGAFDATVLGQNIGTFMGVTTYAIDTANTRIPGSQTFSGVEEIVSDGRYFFSSFFLPPNANVRFVGAAPARIQVAGLVDIQGNIEVQGQGAADVNVTVGANPTAVPGGRGGSGGGDGGNGGEAADGVSPLPSFDGADGGTTTLPAGHAYFGRVAGTAGLGCPQFPETDAQVTYSFFGQTSTMITGGGGGGGSVLGGGASTVSFHANAPSQGPSVNASTSLYPAVGGMPDLSLPGGTLATDHFATGGAGGGGSGSTPNGARVSTPPPGWNAGGGGGGGGGVVQLAAGHDLQLAAGATITAAGGNGTTNLGGQFFGPSGGGGGGGGAILLQAAGNIDLAGLLDARGGAGGAYGFVTQYTTAAGAGGDGLIRLETAGTPNPLLLQTALPQSTSRVVPLTVAANRTSFRSRFYNSNEVLPPIWTSYVIEAVVDSQPMLFTDDASLANEPNYAGPALLGTAPIGVKFQGANLDSNNVPQSIQAWRDYVGTNPAGRSLADDSRSAYRYLIVLDRSMATTATITMVTVRYSI